MKRLAKPQHGWEAGGLSEQKVRQSNPSENPTVIQRDPSTQLRSAQDDRRPTSRLSAITCHSAVF
jgi:hypothetical protein